MTRETLEVDLNGYTDIPDGKVASVVTYLEMKARPQVKMVNRPDLELVRAVDITVADFKALYRRIGDEWMWFGRLMAGDEKIAQTLMEPERELYLPMKSGEAVGLLELDFKAPENVELSYFGLVAEHIGGGAGRWLMNKAIDLVWSRVETRRFWVHTCTMDSPQALGFYRACGFTPYQRALEIADDPRLTGVLPSSAGPHFPLLGD